MVDRLDRRRRCLLIAIDRLAIAFDGVDDVRHGACAFVGDRRVERREIDRPYRLSAEYERIVAQAFAMDLRLERKLAQTLEARLRLVRDAAVEQAGGGEVARILERLA